MKELICNTIVNILGAKILVEEGFLLAQIFSLIWSPAYSDPPASFAIIRQLRPGLTCASSLTGEASQLFSSCCSCCITEQYNTLSALFHIHEFKTPTIPDVAEIDSEKRVCPSHTDSTLTIGRALFSSQNGTFLISRQLSQ